MNSKEENGKMKSGSSHHGTQGVKPSEAKLNGHHNEDFQKSLKIPKKISQHLLNSNLTFCSEYDPVAKLVLTM